MSPIHALRRWWAATRCEHCHGTGSVMLLPATDLVPCPECSVVAHRRRAESAQGVPSGRRRQLGVV